MYRLFILSFLWPWAAYAQGPQTLVIPAKQVSVFFNGAQIFHEGEASLSRGENQVTLAGLPSDLSAESIQVKGSKDFQILGVKHELNRLGQGQESPQIVALRAEIADLELRRDMRQANLMVYEEEKSMILSNKVIGGDQGVLLVEDLEDMANFYRSRLKDISFKMLEISRELTEMQQSLEKLKARLNDLNATANVYQSQMVVVLYAETPIKTKLQFSYLIKSASWHPVYDIRVNEIGEALDLVFKAEVRQSSGVDWNKVQMRLSSGNPKKGGQPPSLNPWWLWVEQPEMVASKRMEVMADEMDAMQPRALPSVAGEKAMVTSQENLTLIEYDINVLQSLASDNNWQQLELKRISIPADYHYLAVPKLDKSAFLMAEIVHQPDYHLLPGAASIYFKGTFVSKSYLNPATGSENMSISLGRDPGVVVERKLIQQYSETTNVGAKKMASRGYNISIKNNKTKTIKLLVQDQLPLSQQEEVEIVSLELSEAIWDKESGALSWTFDLAPGAEKNIDLRYAVKFPKKYILSNY